MHMYLKIIPYFMFVSLLLLLLYIDYLIVSPLRTSSDIEKAVIGFAWFMVECALLFLIFLGSIFVQEKLYISYHYTKLKVDEDDDFIEEP